MRRGHVVGWIWFGLWCLLLPAQAESFAGKVVSVTDGDTIQVMRDGRAEKIRLHGIDTPETGQDFSTVAKGFTSKLCFGEVVTVEAMDTDRYGRLVGVVTLRDGRVLNHELVKNGYAWWYQQYAPDDALLKQYEEEARTAKLGLWTNDQAIAPWEFRKGKRAEPKPPASAVQPAPLGDAPPAASGLPSESSAATAGQPVVAPSLRAPPAEETAEPTAYATQTGKKYQADGCRYLAKSRIPMLLSQTSTSGLTPCSVCGPPSAALESVLVAPQEPVVVTAPPATSITHRPQPNVAATAESASTSETVYVTRTGAKYHRAGCRYLSKSQIPTPLD